MSSDNEEDIFFTALMNIDHYSDSEDEESHISWRDIYVCAEHSLSIIYFAP